MIKRVGTDIVEIRRIKELFLKDIGFIERILSTQELNIFQSIEHEKRKISFLAGRWAAKEAIIKTIKDKPELDIKLNEIIILNDDSGAPQVSYPGDLTLLLSISHSEDYALGFAIAISNPT